jgi:catechol 2,3-dioxygenase-like lactoylglutathione lyase family enzyme
MEKPIIAGIQQVGVGVPQVYDAWKWYRTAFAIDTPVLDDASTAELMLPYTGGEPRERHAVIALNMQGGGGLEVWQYTSRKPAYPSFEVQAGDLGISCAKVKSRDVKATYAHLKSKGLEVLGEVTKMPNGQDHCFVKDPYNNIFEVVPSDDWFNKKKPTTGGMYGAMIGVTDIERSKEFYNKILGYDTVIYDEKGQFDDLKAIPGGDAIFRRVLLTHSKKRIGPFSDLLGKSEIELLQVEGRTPKKIYANRFWGDIGFIQVCYDIQGMDAMRNFCKANGHPFTVDSGDFDMGEAAAQFAYIEDPDGTLIEFVEAHKIPIAKKIGWYLNLKKRDPKKSLPRWMLKALGFNRVKD